LRGAGLLSLARLVEAGGGSSYGSVDRSLLTALVDHWRPETHTFHLPCGEMAPTLQDAGYLLGLAVAGEAVGPRVVPPGWMDDLQARFAQVDRRPDLGPVLPNTAGARGPSKKWLMQFQVNHSIAYE
jgi:hypothetical protein